MTEMVRIVRERLRLDACRQGDEITIPHSPTGSWKKIGRVVVDRIKALPRGLVQIKYRDAERPGAVVQKVDLDGGIVVDRIRPATEEDGPGAGEIVPRTMVVDGVRYRATDPSVDLETALAAAAARRTTRLGGVGDPFGSRPHASALMGATPQMALGLAVLMSGGMLSRR